MSASGRMEEAGRARGGGGGTGGSEQSVLNAA